MNASIANRIILLLLFIGIGGRIFLFFMSPPNNAHDNHLEVVYWYANNFSQPSLFQCFECYQPPLYYYISASIYNITQYLGLEVIDSWKAVQSINTILSILVLLLFYKILVEFGVNHWTRILYLSFLVTLPRDIFTSAMIVNDYFVVFAGMGALLYYLRCLRCFEYKETHGLLYNFICMSIFVLSGALAKQHGLSLLLLPSSFVFIYFFENKEFTLKKLFPIALILICLAFSDEYRKYQEYGKFLVSNYDYYPNAYNQFPGSLDKVEFLTFRIFKLFEQPFITEETSASIPTEVFARTFFDYEWRFLSPRTSIANWVGRLAYLLGLFWAIFFAVSLFRWLKTKVESKEKINWLSIGYLVPISLGIVFLAVPFIQTIRAPHFSCMKAMFALPGMVILLALSAIIFNNINISKKYAGFLIIFNILYVLILLASIYNILATEIALDNLKGPLWKYPEFSSQQ